LCSKYRKCKYHYLIQVTNVWICTQMSSCYFLVCNYFASITV
jgi:hypothetical protein